MTKKTRGFFYDQRMSGDCAAELQNAQASYKRPALLDNEAKRYTNAVAVGWSLIEHVLVSTALLLFGPQGSSSVLEKASP